MTKVLGPVMYQLCLPEQWSIHLVFHVDLLTPYKETEFHGRNFERPLPDLINGEEEYEVEHIINSRRFGRGRQVQYLVHWKGYPESDDQWIPWSDLKAPELLVPLPPTSLPHTLHNVVYMSNGSAPFSQSTAQG